MFINGISVNIHHRGRYVSVRRQENTCKHRGEQGESVRGGSKMQGRRVVMAKIIIM